MKEVLVFYDTTCTLTNLTSSNKLSGKTAHDIKYNPLTTRRNGKWWTELVALHPPLYVILRNTVLLSTVTVTINVARKPCRYVRHA
jgi:hypothetical protein